MTQMLEEKNDFSVVIERAPILYTLSERSLTHSSLANGIIVIFNLNILKVTLIHCGITAMLDKTGNIFFVLSQ